MSLIKKSIIAVMILSFAAIASVVSAFAKDIWVLETSEGKVEIELFADKAPKHVERIKTLTKEGFYDGIVFHRVIEGFMAQGGDPTGTGAGGSDKPDVVAEFNSVAFDRGIVGAARTADPNTFNSQFFIMFAAGHGLNGQYTAFGKVISGMDNVDKLERGLGRGGIVPTAKRDKIVKATIITK